MKIQLPLVSSFKKPRQQVEMAFVGDVKVINDILKM